MPDLKNPAAQGTKMQPKFFLTSATLPFGTPDAERRGTVAEWMTANPVVRHRVREPDVGRTGGRRFLSTDRRHRPGPQAIGAESGRSC